MRVWVHVEGDSRWGKNIICVLKIKLRFDLILKHLVFFVFDCIAGSPYWDWDGFTLGTDEAGDYHTYVMF